MNIITTSREECGRCADNGVLCDLRSGHDGAHHGWLVTGGGRIEFHWPRWIR